MFYLYNFGGFPVYYQGTGEYKKAFICFLRKLPNHLFEYWFVNKITYSLHRHMQIMQSFIQPNTYLWYVPDIDNLCFFKGHHILLILRSDHLWCGVEGGNGVSISTQQQMAEQYLKT